MEKNVRCVAGAGEWGSGAAGWIIGAGNVHVPMGFYACPNCGAQTVFPDDAADVAGAIAAAARSARNLVALCARQGITCEGHGFESFLDQQMDAFAEGGPDAPASALREVLIGRRNTGLDSVHKATTDTSLQARKHSDMHTRMRSYAYPSTPRG